MVLSETIKVKVNGRTVKKYRDLGYEFSHVGDEIEVYYKDLSPYSEEKILVECDFCHKQFLRTFAGHYKVHNGNLVGEDCCYDCKTIKSHNTVKNKYGVNNPFEIPEVKEKIKNTLYEKYGVNNPSQIDGMQEYIANRNMQRYGVRSTSSLDSVKEKVKKTNMERYGVDYPAKLASFQKRITDTCMEKYGVPRPLESDEVKQKIKETMLRNYGVENPFLNKEIMQKAIHSKYLHGSHTCSKQQYFLWEAIGGELNYPLGRSIIDIGFPEDKIAVEYNGGGHDLSVRLGYISREKFNRNENFRRKSLYNQGWKLITFISKKSLILDPDAFTDCMKYALNSFVQGRHWIEFNLDNKTIHNSKMTISLNNIISMND